MQTSSPGRISLKTSLLLCVAVLAFVMVPGLFWHDVWFGRVLDDVELEQYLNDEANPRRVQHGLAQFGERILRGDSQVSRWYPRVIELAAHRHPEIRTLSAWLMGQDSESNAFQNKLVELLEDPQPLVRRNAALSLVRFGDNRGLGELNSMLLPWVVRSPLRGEVRFLVEEGEEVQDGSPIVEIKESGRSLSVKAPVSGTAGNLVEEGKRTNPGDELMVLLPDTAYLWEALRALYLVGTEEELEVIELFLEPGYHGESIRAQALLTYQAIVQRQAQKATNEPGSKNSDLLPIQ